MWRNFTRLVFPCQPREIIFHASRYVCPEASSHWDMSETPPLGGIQKASWPDTQTTLTGSFQYAGVALSPTPITSLLTLYLTVSPAIIQRKLISATSICCHSWSLPTACDHRWVSEYRLMCKLTALPFISALSSQPQTGKVSTSLQTYQTACQSSTGSYPDLSDAHCNNFDASSQNTMELVLQLCLSDKMMVLCKSQYI